MTGGNEYPLMPSSPDDGAEIETSIYDECERHENCVVEIWRNSVTGEVSIGWWEKDE